MADDDDRSVRDNRHKAGPRPFLTPPGFGRERGAPGKEINEAIGRQNQLRTAKEKAASIEAQKPATVRTSDEEVNRLAEQQGYRLIDDPSNKQHDSPSKMRTDAGMNDDGTFKQVDRKDRSIERSPILRPSAERRPHFRGREQGDQGRGR